MEERKDLTRKEPIAIDPEVLPPFQEKSPEERIAEAKKGVDFLRYIILLPAYSFTKLPPEIKKELLEQLEGINNDLDGKPRFKDDQKKWEMMRKK